VKGITTHVVAVAVLAALAALAACGSKGEGDEEGVDPSKTRVPVALGPVVRDSMVEELTLTGRLMARPGGSAVLAAPAAGIVRSVDVRIGDRVARGAVVAELDVPELASDAAQRASAAAQADKEAARQQQLLADGIASARQAEEAASNARQADAAAAAARDLLARTRVRSPMAGRVQSVLVQRGERVDAGKPLAEVIASDTLDLVVRVPAIELPRLRAGLPVEVKQEGDSTAVRGVVSAVAPAVDSLTNAGTAVLRVPNAGGRLHAGAGAVAHIRLGVARDVLVVPDSAIVLSGDSTVVFVVGADSIAHRRAVARGASGGGRTAVTGELEPGERVVTAGAFGLQDGMRVAPGSTAATGPDSDAAGAPHADSAKS
jgi:RND family efflux transporter MFP subunit